jgi:hypothetical protein
MYLKTYRIFVISCCRRFLEISFAYLQTDNKKFCVKFAKKNPTKVCEIMQYAWGSLLPILSSFLAPALDGFKTIDAI